MERCSRPCRCSASSPMARPSSTRCRTMHRPSSCSAMRTSAALPDSTSPHSFSATSPCSARRTAGIAAIPARTSAAHIDKLWPVLERRPDGTTLRIAHSSLLPLPRPYVVPGGRFGEVYYWDSYFTMLGLEESGRHDLALEHGRELREPDRALRPYSQRQPDLFPEPFTAAVLCIHGRTDRGQKPRSCGDVCRIPAGLGQGACLLDGGRRHASHPARRTAASCG